MKVEIDIGWPPILTASGLMAVFWSIHLLAFPEYYSGIAPGIVALCLTPFVACANYLDTVIKTFWILLMPYAAFLTFFGYLNFSPLQVSIIWWAFGLFLLFEAYSWSKEKAEGNDG